MVMVHRRAPRIRIEDVIYRLFNEELGSGCSNIDRYVAELVDENKKIPKYLKSEDLNNCLISVTYTIGEVDLEITEINSYEKIVYIYIYIYFLNSVLDICEAVTRLVNLKLIIIDIHNDKISSKMLERKGFTFKMKNQLGGTLIYEKLLW